MTGPNNRTVLVVDDDEDVRDLICTTLACGGYPAVTAGNGREALDYLRSAPAPPRLVLLDMMMPEMNGWEFLSVRAGEPALAAIPVAIITAVPAVEGRAPELNAVDVLIKPSRMESLLTLVGRICA